MSTISENLLALAQCKADIKAAIIAKGVEVLDSDPFSTYATKISQIPSGGGIPGYEFKTQLNIEVTGEVNE